MNQTEMKSEGDSRGERVLLECACMYFIDEYMEC